MKCRTLALAAAIAIGGPVVRRPSPLPPEAQAQEQFFPVLVYRTGAFAANGNPWANGYVDYLKLMNAQGGVNGVKLRLRGVRVRLRHRPRRRVLRAPQGQGRHRVPAAVHRHDLRAHRQGAGRQDSADHRRLRPQRVAGRLGVHLELPAAGYLLGRRRRRHPAHRQARWAGCDKLKGKKIALVLSRQPLRQGADPGCCRSARRCTASTCSCCRSPARAWSRRRPGCRSAATVPITCCCGAGA